MGKNKKKRTKRYGILALAMMVILMPMTAQAGTWKQDQAGWWWQEDDGSRPVNQWKTIRGNWYAFDDRGYMRCGWYWDGNNWYYLGERSDGAMKTGWQRINGSWYYMYNDGRMAADTWIGSSYVNRSGVWISDATPSHWIVSGDRWWYRHTDGSYTMNGWEVINNRTYHFDSQGWMHTGWQKIDGSWYYFGPVGDGVMRKSQWSGDYYLGSDGKMLTSCWVGDYYVGVSGKYEKDTWIQDSYVGSDGKKLKNQWIDNCYVDENGKKKTSQWIGESYVGADGKMVRNAWIDDYYVGEDGVRVKNTWVDDRYVGPDGKWDKTKPIRVPLETIKIAGETRVMKQGEEQQISWQYFPENTTDDLTACWTSSDEKVASVVNGKVTAHGSGIAEITLTVSGVSQSYNLMVLPEDLSALSLQIKYPTEGASCLRYGETAEASVLMQPGNIHVETYGVWSSDDENIITAGPAVGKLKSTGVGETTVRVRFGDTELSSKVTVISPEDVIEKFVLDKKTLYLGKRQTGHVYLTVKPTQYSWSDGIIWGSTDESVATVDNGAVTARKPGKTTVYAELLGHRAECEVIVTGEEDVIEYSYNTESAKRFFDEINRQREANGVEPFIWKEEDAVYASKLRAGFNEKVQMYRKDQLISIEKEGSGEVQILFSAERNFGDMTVLNRCNQNGECLAQLMKQTNQPLTAGCAFVEKRIDGKVEECSFVFTIGPTESELGQYSQAERETYWTNWIGIKQEEIGNYLF